MVAWLALFDYANRAIPETTDFGYDSNNRLNRVRDSLQADWVAQAASSRDTDAARTLITYDGSGRAIGVQLASTTGLTSDTARQGHTYTYSTTAPEATVNIAGLTPAQGFYGKFVWDAAGRTTSATDVAGVVTQMTYNNADQVTSTKNLATGRQSTAIFGPDNRLTDSYGPAPSSCFGTDNKPLTGSCTSSVAHSITEYDTGLPGGDHGLAAEYWNTQYFTGDIKSYEYKTTDLSYGWGAGNPPNTTGDAWSGRFTGRVSMTANGAYNFTLNVDDGARVYIDDTLVASHWPGEADVFTPFVNTVVAGTTSTSHRIRVDFTEGGGLANVAVSWSYPGQASQVIPVANLTPNFGLTTKTTTVDGNSSSPSHVVTTGYSNPAYGLATTSSEDPAGANLTTTSWYEDPVTTYGCSDANPCGFRRRMARTLPGGNSYNYAYYGVGANPTTRDNPCKPVDSVNNPAVDQGGGLMKSTAPTDSSGVAQVDEVVYDALGQIVASHANSDPWTCMTYDARGRLTQKVIPAFGTQPARMLTYNFAVGNGPLTTSVTDVTGTDPPSTITTVSDLLGQMVSYTDVWGKSTAYSYDQAGRQTQSNSTGANDCRTTSYDAKSRISSQGVGFDCAGALPLATTTYDGTTGELTDVTYPTGSGYNGNGTKGHIDRDAAGRTSKLTWQKSDNTLITSDEVAYSQGSRVINQLIDGTDPYTAGDNFVYDGAGRLTTARTKVGATAHTLVYGFNVTGCNANGTGVNNNAYRNANRSYASDNGTVLADYCYDNADRLYYTNDSRYSNPQYDSHGNTTGLGSTTMTYDGADRHMTTVSGGTTITYKRDALDRIVERTTTGVGDRQFRPIATPLLPQQTVQHR